jgi:hypothetical protein
MLVALVISHLLMPAALTLLDNHYLCLWLVRNINKDNKNRINLSFSLLSDISTPKPYQSGKMIPFLQTASSLALLALLALLASLLSLV